jgi:hypothetical protein
VRSINSQLLRLILRLAELRTYPLSNSTFMDELVNLVVQKDRDQSGRRAESRRSDRQHAEEQIAGPNCQSSRLVPCRRHERRHRHVGGRSRRDAQRQARRSFRWWREGLINPATFPNNSYFTAGRRHIAGSSTLVVRELRLSSRRVGFTRSLWLLGLPL